MVHTHFRQNNQDGDHGHRSTSSRLSAHQDLVDCDSHTSHTDILHTTGDVSPPNFSHFTQYEEINSQDRPGSPVLEVVPVCFDSSGEGAGHDTRDRLHPDILLFDIENGFDRYSNYEPIQVHPDLRITKTCDFSFSANNLGSQMHIPGWRHELSYENDTELRDYLDFGIHNGFLIVDQNCDVLSYECRNYSSVLSGEAFQFVDDIIHRELAEGKYVVSSSKPHCVHSLGAVPKKGTNKWRPITDCRRPLGHSINTCMSTTFNSFCFTTVDKIIDMLRPGMFMASVDIAAAYRSVLVHPSQWKYQGVSWCVDGIPTYLLDTHLCFGLRCAPYIFTQISNFVIRCLKRRGFTNCTVYLDDFLVTGETEHECRLAQQCLIEILRSLGFFIAWDKCVSPCQHLTYLGVIFDTSEMSVKVPPNKLRKLHDELKFFEGRKRATLKQVQRLCGILAHCSKVVKGGRTFSHRVIELLKGWPPNVKRIRLSDRFKYDIMWWRDFASVFNGKNLMVKYNYGQGPYFTTDACIAGYGLWSDQDWQAGLYDSSLSPDISFLNPVHSHWVNVHLQDVSSANNINVLELIPIWLSLVRWGHIWRDLHAVCFTDNTSVMFMVNKGISANSSCMVLLRDIFWRCAINNIHLTARHVPGNVNVIADLLSRVKFTHDFSFLDQFSLCCSGQGVTRGHGEIGYQSWPHCEFSMGGFDPEDSKLPVVEVY